MPIAGSQAHSAGMADPDITAAIDESAAGPKSISVAGMGSSEEHPLPDLIAAAKFRAPASVRRRVGGGIRFTQATPPGAR